MPTLEKTKSGRKAIKDDESSCGSNEGVDEEMYLGTILIGTIPVSLNCSTSSLTLPTFFKSQEMEESLVEVKEKQPTVNEGCIYKGITIEPFKESRPQQVILEKPNMKMTKTQSMSNLQEESHQRFINGNTLRSISLPSGKLWQLLKRNRSTPRPSEGKCWGNGLYPNVLSQGRLFNHYCFQIFTFLQRSTFFILILSQSKLLSHCSQASKFFPNTQ